MGDAGAQRNEISGRTGRDVVQARDIGEIHFHGAAVPAAVVPGQLPAATAVFVNRAAERAVFHDVVGRLEEVPSPRVVVLSGLRGVGKSAAAARWAHEIRDRFDGGQLYVDLGRQSRRGAVDVSEVLEQFIEALGGDPHDHGGPRRRADGSLGADAGVGAGEAARLSRLQGEFLQRSAGRRLLILLDDVTTAAQVTAVLPASAESVVVVTSHRRLEGLLRDGAELVTLGPLDADHGAELIGAMVGADRVRREPDAVAEVVWLCGGLPIALRVLGAQLRARPRRRIAAVAERLRDERRRLDHFSMDGERVIEAAFEVVYGDLPEDAQVLYRVLGVHPGPEFDGTLLAAALGQPIAMLEETLDLLVLANLVDADETEGRYRLPELVRVHALRRAEIDDPAQDRDGLLRRMVEVYLRRAVLADRAVLGPRLRLADHPWLAEATAEFGGFADPAAALRWFEAERRNLLGCVRVAARRGWDTAVWVLCEALWAFYYNRKHYGDWIESHELAVESARRLGHAAAEARMRSQLGRALVELERYDEAHAQFDAALPLARAAADRRLEASVVEFSGRARFEQGEYPAAIASFERSRAVNAEIGNARGVALQTHHLGRALSRSGRQDEAVDVFAEALAGFAAVGDERNQARVLISLGETHRDLGRYPQAERALGEASSIMRRRDIPFQVALAQELLADVARRAGDETGWRAHLEAAFATFAEAGSPRAEQVWRLLHGEQPGS